MPHGTVVQYLEHLTYMFGALRVVNYTGENVDRNSDKAFQAGKHSFSFVLGIVHELYLVIKMSVGSHKINFVTHDMSYDISPHTSYTNRVHSTRHLPYDSHAYTVPFASLKQLLFLPVS